MIQFGHGVFVFKRISPEDLGISDDELLLGYFESQLMGANGISLFAARGPSSLEEADLTIYNTLKSSIQSIAAGDTPSTAIPVEAFEWTYAELGITSTSTDDEINAALQAKLGDITAYLLADLPYDLYWYNKTAGIGLSLSMSNDTANSKIMISSATLNFTPSADYKDAEDYTVDTAKTSAASAAAANAAGIVTENAGGTDLERLTAYKDAICGLVSYDEEAASSSYDIVASGISP